MDHPHSKVEFLILGGGLAGIAAALRLTELGAKPWLIEAGDYPSHKVCGEFFFPDCIPILKKWEIETIAIPHVQFQTPSGHFKFQFPTAAGGLSHLSCDPKLVERAKAGGAIFRTKTKVTHLDLEQRRVTLDTGEKIQAQQLILSTGRLTNAKPKMLYMGIKAHFESLPYERGLQMFSYPGAYFGISPIEENRFNVACLATMECFKQFSSAETLMEKLLPGKKPIFPWMTVEVPAFGIKTNPTVPFCYFVGDAAGTIPPAAGKGLSLAVTGGVLAAEYAFRGDAEGFRKEWRRQHHLQIMWGKMLHQAMLRPWLLNGIFGLSKVLPIPKFIYSHLI